MTYEEALQRSIPGCASASSRGWSALKRFCKKLGDPQKKPRFVHVAGTNGKGTTCTLIASVLTAAGYRTASTSPYVLDFRERFRIDGEAIPEAELIEEVKRVSPVADELEAAGDTVTEFEFITALAFDWFAQRDCDLSCSRSALAADLTRRMSSIRRKLRPLRPFRSTTQRF